MAKNPELFKASRKKYEETIFFVPFYAGTKKAIGRHIKWVNSLGYDAFAFDLDRRSWLFDIPVTSELHLGWKHFHAEQIEELLNELPGRKILYSFSNPSAAAIEALGRRHCADIMALICDSGPSAKFISSVANMLTRDMKIQWPFNMAAAAVMSFSWNPLFQSELNTDLEKFPNNFPILSIRGWKDPLIPPDHIDLVFEPHKNLDWRKLSLPKAAHLNGLRDFPDEYKPPVLAFLKSFSTATHFSKQLDSGH